MTPLAYGMAGGKSNFSTVARDLAYFDRRNSPQGRFGSKGSQELEQSLFKKQSRPVGIKLALEARD